MVILLVGWLFCVVAMLGLEHPSAGSRASGGIQAAPRVRGPHVSEAQVYLGRIRWGIISFYCVTIAVLVLWLPILALISGATALCGSLLLQSDPLLEPFMSQVVLLLGEWLLTLPEWARYPVKDGLLYLTPLTICCCLGCATACVELFLAIPSHSTGLGGILRPLMVLMCGCLHATIFACCWHFRGLIWRPHGSVVYADLYEAAIDRGRPDAEDVKLPTAAPVSAAPMKPPSRELEAGGEGTEFHRPVVPVAPAAPVALAHEPQTLQVPPDAPDVAVPVAQADPEASEVPKEVETVELLLRLPSGRRVRCHFLSSDLISQIYDAVEAEAGSEADIRSGNPYCLVTIHPKQAFQDKELTLAEAGLQNSTVLNVEMVR